MADSKVDKLAPGAKGKDGKEICRAFRNNGKCRFEKDCKYEHSSGPQIEAPPRDYTPKGDCHNWTETKSCRFAERCRFLHGPDDKRTTYRQPKADNTTGEQEICRNFQNRGKCRFGENCKHKHVASDKPKGDDGKAGGAGRPRRRRRGGAAGGGAGAGAGGKTGGDRKEAKPKPQAEYDKDGVEICRKNKEGKCKFGAECSYSHGASVGTSPAGGAKPVKKPREIKECTEFAKGTCEYGDECRFKHGANDKRDLSALQRRPRRRPRRTGNGAGGNPGVCYSWSENGSCEYGDNCKFSHTK
jgi:hypothetical protein